MPKSLIITEKPSVARDIVAALGGFTEHGGDYWESDQYLCTFAVGHILEFLEPEEIDPAYKRWVLATLPIIPSEYKLKPKSGQSDRLRVIKKLATRNDVETLINACDAGREGELIFREIVKYLEVKKPIRRLWLQSMTADALRDGFQRLQDGRKFEGLGAAAECRAVADWLIGMNASRALTIRMRSKANKGAWSAGRVQTPTLALLVDRELEVLRHVPESYWRVVGTFDAGAGTYEGVWTDPTFQSTDAKPQLKADRIFDAERARQIALKVTGKSGTASETRKASRESAPPLFDLTSLQREANRRFGWTARRTLNAAQRCYETHKVLTYPRTDSRCLPEDYVAEVDKLVASLSRHPDYKASAAYLIANGRQNESRTFNNAGVSDHFAIIPTGQLRGNLQGDDYRIFDFVVRRFLATFFPPAIWDQVERTTLVENETFLSRARTLMVPGWRSVYDQDTERDESKGLTPLIPGSDKAENVPARAVEVATQEDQTKPPPRINEAKLLSLMENAGQQIEDEDLAAALHDKGLGTPATRADIIENLKSKDYVDNTLRPTVKGMRLIDLLHRINAQRLTSAELTGELELHLNQVEKGKRQAQDFVNEIVGYTNEIVEAAGKFDYDKIYPNVDPVGVCPCDKKRPVYERSWFYRCQEDPAEQEAGNDCPFRIWKDKSGRYIDRATAEVLLRDGRTGELDGFRDRRGRTYKAVLKIEGKEVLLEPIAGSESGDTGEVPTFEVNTEPLGQCPIHKEEECLVVETPTEFICQMRAKQLDAGERKPQGFMLPRLVCKREITREEALAYLKNGETEFITDFTSRWGKPFTAKLKLSETTGRHQFEFQASSRKRGFGKKKEEGEDGEAKPAAEAKVKKKAATKSRKKAAGKKAKSARKTAKAGGPKVRA